MRPNFLARPALIPRIFIHLPNRTQRLRSRPPRLAPRRCISAPPVEGVLRRVTETRKQKVEKSEGFGEPFGKALKSRAI